MTYSNKIKALYKKKRILAVKLFFTALLIGGLLIASLLKNEGINRNKNSEEGDFACQDLSCWQTIVHETLDSQGIDAALEVVADFYHRNPSFGQFCHDLVHEVGELAYREFRRNKDSSFLTSKTAFCSYGFYHAFMESFILDRGDPKAAREFCLNVDKKLGRVAPDVLLQCFHGIGHGAASFRDGGKLPDKQLIAKRALAFCEKASSSFEERSRCATGVFNTIAIFFITGELPINKTNPLSLCDGQLEQYKAECYISMNVALLWLTNHDFLQAAKFIEQIPKNEHAVHAMRNLAAPIAVGKIDKTDYRNEISICRSLQERLHLPCIQGLAFGFLEHGEPGKEYEKPLAFCQSSSLLTQAEQRACLQYLFSYLPLWYAPQKAYQICKLVEHTYAPLCYKEIDKVLQSRDM